MNIDERYMARAIEIARKGYGNVSPNPMVGAVIVYRDRIIGEGYHRKFGGPHAEVNAIASVSEDDRAYLGDSTIYVTLEPCSHYGKTPPCADLIVRTGIPRVVIGCLDPFIKVSGKGVAKLKDAGIEVTTGVLEEECRHLNMVFMTAHTLGRPFVTLKWAQSADGFLGAVENGMKVPVKFSTAESLVLVHAMRARHDAILVGAGTVIADTPSLGVRYFSGKDPVAVILDRRGIASGYCRNITGRLLYYSSINSSVDEGEWIEYSREATIEWVLKDLYSRGITSVLVEGGGDVLRSFIDSGLFDEARVEVAPVILGGKGATKAPHLNLMPVAAKQLGDNYIYYYRNNKYSWDVLIE